VPGGKSALLLFFIAYLYF